MKRIKLIAVVGPNASGKSALGVALAKKCSGEVTSADSRQVYRGLDIGTGKITKREMQGVRHHLLDVASPRRAFSAARFKTLAERAIRDITRRGKIPIIVGGTGFYFDTLFGSVRLPPAPPNTKLRAALEKKATAQLVALLKKLDTKRASNIDTNNRRRLIRAIEIAKALGSVPKEKQGHYDISKYDIFWIGVTHPKEVLRKRIQKRVHERIRRGMVAEAKRLHAKGLSYKRMRELGLEYRHLADYLERKIDRNTLIKTIEEKDWQYAKRQMTWFKRNKEIHWVNPTEQGRIERRVKKWL